MSFGGRSELTCQVLEGLAEFVGAVDGEGPFQGGEEVGYAVQSFGPGAHQDAGRVGR